MLIPQVCNIEWLIWLLVVGTGSGRLHLQSFVLLWRDQWVDELAETLALLSLYACRHISEVTSVTLPIWTCGINVVTAWLPSMNLHGRLLRSFFSRVWLITPFTLMNSEHFIFLNAWTASLEFGSWKKWFSLLNGFTHKRDNSFIKSNDTFIYFKDQMNWLDEALCV